MLLLLLFWLLSCVLAIIIIFFPPVDWINHTYSKMINYFMVTIDLASLFFYLYCISIGTPQPPRLRSNIGILLAARSDSKSTDLEQHITSFLLHELKFPQVFLSLLILAYKKRSRPICCN